MNTILRDIGEFIFFENIPEKADGIMAVVGSHPELEEKAAELWKNGYAPYVYFKRQLVPFRGWCKACVRRIEKRVSWLEKERGLIWDV
jgi:hypothetical protein